MILDKLGEIVLDHVWAADRDEIQFQLEVNLFRKIGAAQTRPDMTADDIERLCSPDVTIGDYKLVL